MQLYKTLFEQRGSSYDTAMRLYPEARNQEFGQVIHAAQLKAGMVVGDVPAGGNYLRNYMPADCEWLGHDPCATFTNHGALGATQSRPLLPIPWDDERLDVAVSLAGVHHLEDKVSLFKEINRTTKSRGKFILSDVQAGSGVALFLDGYIGDNNSTGHEGIYLDHTTEIDLKNSGWEVEKVQLNHFHWLFDSLEDMAIFCHTLFDLKHSSVATTQKTILKELGASKQSDQKIGMNWSLLTIECLKIKHVF